MSRMQPIMAFLRPAVAPRAVAWRPTMHFSSATRLHADKAPSPKPSSKAPSPPSSPKDAARAADLAAAEAATDADSGQPPAPKPVLPSDHTQTPPTTTQTDSVSVPEGETAKASKTKTAKLKAQSTRKLKETKKASIPKTQTIELPPARYHVERTKGNKFPVYTDFKRGGNLHLTLVRKITGDLSALRDELRLVLNKQNGEVWVNALTQNVVVKGHHKAGIDNFLRSRGM